MRDHLIASSIFGAALGVIALCIAFPLHFMALGYLAVFILMLAAVYTWILDEVRWGRRLYHRPTGTPKNNNE